jgi:hypothetical protein
MLKRNLSLEQDVPFKNAGGEHIGDIGSKKRHKAGLDSDGHVYEI